MARLGVLLKYTVHLLRHTVKKCPQRIKDTPAVLFYRIPCICIVYFKRLTEGVFQNGHGCPWFHVAASLPRKLVVEQLYKDVQLLNKVNR